MAIRYREGGAEIEITGDMERLALEAVDRALPGVRRVMEANLEDIYNQALSEWPEKTGRSRSGLKKVWMIDENSIAMKIENAVPYAVYVRPKAWFGTTTAWQRLIRAPMRAAAKEVARRVGWAIINQLKQVQGG